MDAIIDLKNRHDLQCLENLSFITEKQHGWNETTTKNNLSFAVDRRFLQVIKRTKKHFQLYQKV